MILHALKSETTSQKTPVAVGTFIQGGVIVLHLYTTMYKKLFSPMNEYGQSPMSSSMVERGSGRNTIPFAVDMPFTNPE